MDAFKQAFRENPITLVGGSWLAVVAGTLFVVQRKKIPMQLKIIQARIVAQGALLTGCVRGAGPSPPLCAPCHGGPPSHCHPALHPASLPPPAQGIAAIIAATSTPEPKADPRARFQSAAPAAATAAAIVAADKVLA